MVPVGTYMRTLRYLRGRQLAARAALLLPRRRPGQGPHPPLRPRGYPLVAPVARPAEWLAPDHVHILNIDRTFAGGVDWAPTDVPRLFRYHLHYFSDLPGRAADSSSAWLVDVVRSWISSNPPLTPDAWDPYPTSLRILNWFKWLLLEGPDPADREDIVQSLAVQVRHLERSVEHHLSGNHLLANAAALAASGFCFAGSEGDRWLARGLRLLDDELREQVLPDGGHYERSPMYHALVLEQLLDVLNLAQGAGGGAEEARETARRLLEPAAAAMLAWLGLMSHPDGNVSFFNDSTMGVAATVSELSDYAARLRLAEANAGAASGRPAPARTPPSPAGSGGVVYLRDSGYFRLGSSDGRTAVIFDAGPVGPDHQPGHGHCDALSFELSHGGRRVLVNSGISTYGPGPERLRQRRTRAHNTVLVDGAEQCELWASHRCGRRHGILSASASGQFAEASHSGFAHLPGGPLHHRTVQVDDRGVRIRDGFDGEGDHLIEWSLRVHPDLDVAGSGPRFSLLSEGRRLGTLRFPPEASPSLGESTWHPGFNLAVKCPLVVAEWRGRLPADFEFEIVWE